MNGRIGEMNHRGVALFILLTSLVILSLSMRELLVLTGMQTDRIRSQIDRVQALYLARSTLNLSRFYLLFDEQVDRAVNKEEAADTLSDLWAQPVIFPLPAATVQSMGAFLSGSNSEAPAAEPDEALIKACDLFFADFTGNAEAITTDLSATLSLNDLNNPDLLKALINLLQADPDFLASLSAKGLNAESLAREIRDYADPDETENETNSLEESVYRAAQLDYAPKNRPYTQLTELKLVPSIDDEIWEYLSPFVNAVYIAQRPRPAKINMNTASREVIEALLTNVSDPRAVSEEIVADREENARRYTDKNIMQTLESLFGLTNEEIKGNLIGGQSNAFHIRVTSRVNQTQIQVDAITGRGFAKPIDPFVLFKVSP
jgi:type II secretory pathway component PulK